MFHIKGCVTCGPEASSRPVQPSFLSHPGVYDESFILLPYVQPEYSDIAMFHKDPLVGLGVLTTLSP